MSKTATRKRNAQPTIAEFKTIRPGGRVAVDGIEMRCTAARGTGMFRVWNLVSENGVEYTATFTGGAHVACVPYGLAGSMN